MTLFVFLNWAACLVTSACLTAAIVRHRFLVLKPSIAVILGFHLMIQWAATALSPDVEHWLPRPWAFFWLAQGFPLVGFLGSFMFGNRSAYETWLRVTAPRRFDERRGIGFILVLVGLFTVSSVVYLRYVPWTATGLYAILTDPVALNAAQARETSLKLLETGAVRYLYSFQINAVAPLAGILLAVAVRDALVRRRTMVALGLALMLAWLLAGVSLSGARSYAAMVILGIVWAFVLQRGVPLRPVSLAAGLIVVLALPTLLSILREGNAVTLASFWEYLTTRIASRLLVVPMRMGLWHVQYAQTDGFFGIAGVQRLAPFFGVEPINVANLLARVYVPGDMTSTLANASYVFSYYSYFGAISLAVTLPLLWLLDGALWIYRRLDDQLLLPCVAAASVISVSFVFLDYTIVLVTNGFAILLLLCLVLDRAARVRIRLAGRSRTAASQGGAPA